MNLIGEKIAIGIVMADEEGNDQMQVMQGIIAEEDGNLFFESPGYEPFEMAQGWLEKLKPVEDSMGKEFQGAKYCLVLAAAKQ